MKNLAIIPARGGSKRIPGKNIKNFLGKPIIAYSVEAALKSELFCEVIVSTDDNEIAEVSKKYGATVPFMRSDENADDHATLSDVIDEVTESYTQRGDKFDYACCILPTSPLLTVQNLEKGFNLLASQKLDSVKPVAAFSYPIQRALKMENGLVEMFQPEHKRTRSQDLEQAYHDAGQ
ncbi:MAG: pseudaminic acid cytidylyltransferase, partial [Bacteroidota bacterium]|nr:pseudaminic acid cytidylyltransferase [Bacteroidota bacterium]